MKRVIIVFLMLIYCSTAFLFNHYGRNIRGMLSPKVETTELEYSPVGELSDSSGRSAMQLMAEIQKIRRTLPDIDCGFCGAPTCAAFAEDVVRQPDLADHRTDTLPTLDGGQVIMEPQR